MSMRSTFPQPQLPRTHFFLTFSRGDRASTCAVRVPVLYFMVALLPVLAVWLAGATAYVVFHDDLMASMMSHQVDTQYAYEDRLATMRSELERVTSRQLLDQNSIANKIGTLAARQSLLETRASMISSLTELVNSAGHDAAPRKEAAESRPALSAGARPRAPAAPASALGFAPVAPAAAVPFPALTGAKPHPESIDTTLTTQGIPAPAPGHSSLDPPSPARSLDDIALSLDRIEFGQVRSLALLAPSVEARASRLRAALAEAGLSADRLVVPGKSEAMGGPFVPLKVDPARSPFEREFAGVQDAIVGMEKIRRILPYVPLRRPLPGNPDVTSGFGVRVDPFLGRPALHAGIDFREEYGAPVHATAAGRVVTAGPSGGYGNMVEVDHGNGLSTRYGHMSAILVSEGQWVEVGGVVGKLGSTGRSTGPHLHYETRVDDEAVDPVRFLRAGRNLGSLE